jgi:hypothetical protein
LRSDEAIVVKLRATSAVSSLVGGRIYLGHAIPQGAAKPYIAVEDDSNEPQYHMTGEVTPKTVLGRLDLFVVGYDAVTNRAISKAMRDALSAFRGNVTNAGDTLTFRYMYIDDDIPEPLRTETGTNKVVHVWRQTYRTAYQ